MADTERFLVVHVWMELHEDLLLTLGRGRDASDGH